MNTTKEKKNKEVVLIGRIINGKIVYKPKNERKEKDEDIERIVQALGDIARR